MYKKTDKTIITSEGKFVPEDPGNRDFARFRQWQKKGNEPSAVNPDSTAIYARNGAGRSLRVFEKNLKHAPLQTLVAEAKARKNVR